MRLFFAFVLFCFAKKNPKQVVLFSLCAFVLKLQRVSETCKQGCQLIRTLLHMKHTNSTGTHHAQCSGAQQLFFLSFFFPCSASPFLTLRKWEQVVLSKQLLTLFTYSLIWWSNKPLGMGYLTHTFVLEVYHQIAPGPTSCSLQLQHTFNVQGPGSRHITSHFKHYLDQIWLPNKGKFWPVPRKLAIASQHRK